MENNIIRNFFNFSLFWNEISNSVDAHSCTSYMKTSSSIKNYIINNPGNKYDKIINSIITFINSFVKIDIKRKTLPTIGVPKSLNKNYFYGRYSTRDYLIGYLDNSITKVPYSSFDKVFFPISTAKTFKTKEEFTTFYNNQFDAEEFKNSKTRSTILSVLHKRIQNSNGVQHSLAPLGSMQIGPYISILKKFNKKFDHNRFREDLWEVINSKPTDYTILSINYAKVPRPLKYIVHIIMRLLHNIPANIELLTDIDKFHTHYPKEWLKVLFMVTYKYNMSDYYWMAKGDNGTHFVPPIFYKYFQKVYEDCSLYDNIQSMYAKFLLYTQQKDPKRLNTFIKNVNKENYSAIDKMEKDNMFFLSGSLPIRDNDNIYVISTLPEHYIEILDDDSVYVETSSNEFSIGVNVFKKNPKNDNLQIIYENVRLILGSTTPMYKAVSLENVK